jgi:hypothetical protein
MLGLRSFVYAGWCQPTPVYRLFPHAWRPTRLALMGGPAIMRTGGAAGPVRASGCGADGARTGTAAEPSGGRRWRCGRGTPRPRAGCPRNGGRRPRRPAGWMPGGTGAGRPPSAGVGAVRPPSGPGAGGGRARDGSRAGRRAGAGVGRCRVGDAAELPEPIRVSGTCPRPHDPLVRRFSVGYRMI